MLMLDTLVNFVSGLGTVRDKSASNQFESVFLSKGQIDKAYRGDWLSRKVIDIPAKDAARAGRRWFANKDQIQAIERYQTKLDLWGNVYRALRLGRLYGGALLYMGMDEDASLELDPETVGADTLIYLKVFHRYEVGAEGELNYDIASPYFGLPAMFVVTTRTGQQLRIHPSRCVRFIGAELPDWQMSDIGWGDSVLVAFNDALRAAASAQANLASLVEEAVVDIIKVPDLAGALSTTASTNNLLKRFGLASMLKSNNHTLMLDAAEAHEQKAINFSSLPDVVKTFLQMASGAADIPMTRLIGMSPSGLQSTGDSDIRNYYDKIAADQNTDLRPALAPLDEVLIRSALGSRPEEIYFEFNKLWQLDDLQKATLDKTKADTAAVYINANVLPEAVMQHAILNDLEESGAYPGIKGLQEDFENGKLEPLVEPEPAPQPGFDPITGLPLANTPAVDPATGLPAPGEPAVAKDAAPQPMYVFRPVLNWQEIDKWATDAGFTATVGAAMHVTIISSAAAIDWMTIAPDTEWDKEPTMTFQPGGPRLLATLGDDAQALLFTSSRLCWRYEALRMAGASSDYSEYQPHITLTYGAAPQGGLAGIVPYQGRIVLGPETWQPYDPSKPFTPESEDV
jgi:uncharacterized protein